MTIPQFYRSSCLSLPVSTITVALTRPPQSFLHSSSNIASQLAIQVTLFSFSTSCTTLDARDMPPIDSMHPPLLQKPESQTHPSCLLIQGLVIACSFLCCVFQKCEKGLCSAKVPGHGKSACLFCYACMSAAADETLHQHGRRKFRNSPTCSKVLFF